MRDTVGWLICRGVPSGRRLPWRLSRNRVPGPGVTEPPLDFPASRWTSYAPTSPPSSKARGCTEALRLGWSELDLFGVGVDRPYTRIDALGLVPALDGCRIVEVPRQSFQRRPGRAPVGEIKA